MNNFNKVFLVVKSQCEKQKSFAELSNFDIIAKEANVPLDKLPVYLSHLQEIGLIKFSMTEKYIHLTSFGKRQQTLIKE